MDYYCRKFSFAQPFVDYEEVKGKGASHWEAIMTVGGRRIGIGSAKSKKDAQKNCYMDVVQYLEKCDPDLWRKFVEAAKTGKDLGLAPKVYFQMSDSLGVPHSKPHPNTSSFSAVSAPTGASRPEAVHSPASRIHDAKRRRDAHKRKRELL